MNGKDKWSLFMQSDDNIGTKKERLVSQPSILETYKFDFDQSAGQEAS